MPEHIQYEDDDLFNPETHHEESDVPLTPLFWSVAAFIVIGAITHFAVLGLYKGLVKAERGRMDPPQTAVARPASADVPQNQPLLEPFPLSSGNGEVAPPQSNTPVVNLAELRRREDEVLKTYAWIDRHQGTVRIPIEQAKQLLAARIAVQGQLGGAAPGGAAPSGAVPASGTVNPAAEAAAAPPTTTAGGTHQ